jgi:hypothetical protein
LVRILLFLSSYSPLFLILAIQNFSDQVAWSTVLLALSAVSVAALRIYINKARTLEPHPVTAATAQAVGTEAMGYIVTYIIPFLGLSLGSSKDIASLLILLAMLGVIYVDSNLIYVNPILNIFGYHLFQISNPDGKPSALITWRRYVKQGEQLSVISLGDFVDMEKRVVTEKQ